jgi:PKD repeat protein
VIFTDTSTGNNTTWLWGFGDGTTSTERNPIHPYSARGAYTVTLTVSGADGTDAYALPNAVRIYQQAQANFAANPVSGPAPLQVTFNDQSTGDINTWSWGFGDGNNSFTQNPVHTYEKAGTYPVALTVAGLGGQNTQVRSGYIAVSEPPTPTLTPTPTTTNTPTPTTTPTPTVTSTPTRIPPITSEHKIYLPVVRR